MMAWFSNLRAVTKQLVCFTLMAAVVALVGYLGLSGLDRVDHLLEVTYSRDLVGLDHAASAKMDLLAIGRDARLMVGEKDPAKISSIWADVQASVTSFEKEFAATAATLEKPEEKARAQEIAAGFAEYIRLVKERGDHALAGRDKEASEVTARAKAAREPVQKALEDIIESKHRVATQTSVEGKELYGTVRGRLVLVVVLAVLGAIVLGFVTGRLMARPLNKTVEILTAVAGGDFTRRLDVDTRDEVGQVARAVNDATERMREALSHVRSVSGEVASASEQLNSASAEISSGAQEQASSLEETAANLEQITSVVKRNSDSAQQANRLAAGSREAAEAGGRAVQSTITAMNEISASSRKIADIITTIDEIAFQTNLLALNAAVEAARAGEQGRGFAVVATEVRGLAQRSASAAKEIKGLIQDSVEKVENGSRLVVQSGETLEQIVTSVKRLTDIVGEIAAASGEQSTGIEQVHTAVTQMDTVTQTNASQTEELSATAESLNERAVQLRSLVERFVLDAGGSSQAAAARPSPAAVRAARAVSAPRSVALQRRAPARSRPAAVTSGSGLAAGAQASAPEGFEEF